MSKGGVGKDEQQAGDTGPQSVPSQQQRVHGNRWGWGWLAGRGLVVVGCGLGGKRGVMEGAEQREAPPYSTGGGGGQ